MISEACEFYKWTPEYVLGMPASRFFAMLEYSRKLYNAHMVHLCDIAAIPMCNEDWHQNVRQRFLPQPKPDPIGEEILRLQAESNILEDEQGRDFMLAICAQMKGALGVR